MTTSASATPGSSTASSAVTEPRSLAALVRCRRRDGCGARTGFISAADRQRLADEAQQQAADLVATQDRQQQGGERHRGGHERARAYSASCPPGPPMPWSA